jgi:hypothetical protein
MASSTAFLVMALNTTRLTGLSPSDALLLEHLEHMPGDRFAFAIRVGCEE